MRIVFMGTPDFAVSALEAIVEAGHEVCAVVTQPNKPKGRGKELQFTPVKEYADCQGIPVFQPVKIKSPEAVETLRGFEADIFVVAAFGQILSEEILNMPPYGSVNIHASLLPKYRGAAPIQWAILNGEEETGVTIMQMDAGLDTGDMLLKRTVPIEPKETGESLHDKLAKVGAELIVEALPLIEALKVTAVKQQEEDSCYAKMLTKSLGHIEWQRDAVAIERLVRGMNSWPSAYTHYKGKVLKIWESDIIKEMPDGEPGTVSRVEKDAVVVNTGKYKLSVHTVQLEGKKRMDIKDFLLGYEMKPGMKLGER